MILCVLAAVYNRRTKHFGRDPDPTNSHTDTALPPTAVFGHHRFFFFSGRFAHDLFIFVLRIKTMQLSKRVTHDRGPFVHACLPKVLRISENYPRIKKQQDDGKQIKFLDDFFF